MNQALLIASVVGALLGVALLAGPASNAVAAEAAAAGGSEAATAADSDATTTEAQIEALFERGRRALINGEFATAIRIYTHLQEYPEARQDALEYLGLARERNGQYAHATVDYEEYLRLYPEGEGAERVRQRLAALTTAREEPADFAAAAPDTSDSGLQTFASVSQYYVHHREFDRPGGSSVDLSMLSSNVDVTSRLSRGRYDLAGQFAGQIDKDFADDGPGDEKRVTALFLEAVDRPRGLGVSLGRQPRSTDGVLGRFDGGVVSYQVLPKVRVNALAGLPVEFGALDDIETDRYFVGGSVDIGTLFNHVDLNLYAMNQMVDGETDRRAVGGEARYFHPRGTVFTLLDYDIWFNQVNIFDATGTLFFSNGASLNVVLDYRKTPFLTTTNALLGQERGVSINDLRRTMSEEELRKRAEDNTGTFRFASIGASHPLGERFQVSGDFSVSKLTGAIPMLDDDFPVIDVGGTEFAYLGTLTGRNLVFQGTIATFSIRYSDAEDQDSIAFLLDSTVPVARVWRIGPRLRSDYRWFADDRRRVAVAPTIRLENRWMKRVTLELEAGLEWSNEYGAMGSGDDLAFIGLAGYRFDY